MLKKSMLDFEQDQIPFRSKGEHDSVLGNSGTAVGSHYVPFLCDAQIRAEFDLEGTCRRIAANMARSRHALNYRRVWPHTR